MCLFMMKTLLIVEKDKASSSLMKDKFEKNGYLVRCVYSGKEALDVVSNRPPAAIILEWDLPDMEGIEVCRRVRSNNSMPILMVSTRIDEIDSVVALELGATDYIRKPFGTRELMTRLRIHLERYEKETTHRVSGDCLTVGPFKIDFNALKVFKNTVELSLTYIEFKLLTHLLGRPSEVFSREEIITMLALSDGDRRRVDVHIRRLREKIEDRPSTPKWIKTKSGIGYYFNK